MTTSGAHHTVGQPHPLQEWSSRTPPSTSSQLPAGPGSSRSLSAPAEAPHLPGLCGLSPCRAGRTSVDSSEMANPPPVMRPVKQRLNWRRTSPSVQAITWRGSALVPGGAGSRPRGHGDEPGDHPTTADGHRTDPPEARPRTPTCPLPAGEPAGRGHGKGRRTTSCPGSRGTAGPPAPSLIRVPVSHSPAVVIGRRRVPASTLARPRDGPELISGGSHQLGPF
jgi:hypothetical protein